MCDSVGCDSCGLSLRFIVLLFRHRQRGVEGDDHNVHVLTSFIYSCVALSVIFGSDSPPTNRSLDVCCSMSIGVIETKDRGAEGETSLGAHEGH